MVQTDETGHEGQGVGHGDFPQCLYNTLILSVEASQNKRSNMS